VRGRSGRNAASIDQAAIKRVVAQGLPASFAARAVITPECFKVSEGDFSREISLVGMIRILVLLFLFF
jgi:hypothetical protein